jgi:hypothetical protein
VPYSFFDRLKALQQWRKLGRDHLGNNRAQASDADTTSAPKLFLARAFAVAVAELLPLAHGLKNSVAVFAMLRREFVFFLGHALHLSFHLARRGLFAGAPFFRY